MPTLPLEIVCHIVDSLIPDDSPIAYPQSHPITRTLRSFCLVSSGTYSTAVRNLYAHCVFINSRFRVELFLRSIKTLSDHTAAHPLDNSAPTCPQRAPANLPNIPVSAVNSMLLMPFRKPIIYDIDTAKRIRTLFTILAPSLTRLVLDLPLRSLYPEDDDLGIRSQLRAGFETLTSLREFTATRDELFLKVHAFDDLIDEIDIWTLWPSLERLALYNPDISSDKMKASIAQCQRLKRVVFTRPDGLEDLKVVARAKMDCRFVVVNTDRCHQPADSYVEDSDGHRVPNIATVEVPRYDTDDYNDIRLCQAWVRDQAMERSIWDCGA